MKKSKNLSKSLKKVTFKMKEKTIVKGAGFLINIPACEILDRPEIKSGREDNYNEGKGLVSFEPVKDEDREDECGD